jgi:hypothetical protein
MSHELSVFIARS